MHGVSGSLSWSNMPEGQSAHVRSDVAVGLTVSNWLLVHDVKSTQMPSAFLNLDEEHLQKRSLEDVGASSSDSSLAQTKSTASHTV
jgi:hypothetical protein